MLSYEYQRQLPHVKSIDYLMAIWLQPFVKQNGADDILYHQGGIVSECPRSNFFIINKENKIITPSKNILKGVIRTKLIEIAKTDFEMEERDLSIDEIKSAKEAFITSTTKTLLPISQVDDCIFTRNQITSQLYHSFINVYSLQNV